MIQMTVGEFKAQFSSILEKVLQGEEVQILYGRARTPVAVFKRIEETVKYLIGTDIFVSLLLNTNKISKRAMEIINNEEEIYISPISFWEIATKVQSKDIDLGSINVLHLPHIAEQYNLKLLSPEPYDYVSSTQISQTTNENLPYDLMLVQQAIRNNLTLISTEKKFRKYEETGLHLMW